MAYGKQPLRPGRGAEKIKPLAYPETKSAQKGKTGLEGSDVRDFGTMPSSGPTLPSAGSPPAPKAKATTSAGKATADRGAQVVHVSQKAPKTPGSPGGAKVGSLDTMTSLIFHPKGGMGRGKTGKSPRSSSGYKESGQRGKAQVTGVSAKP